MAAQPNRPGVSASAWSPNDNYEDRLRLIGRYLDLAAYRSPTIVEVEGGVLVRAFAERSRVPEALEFPHDGYEELLQAAIAERGRGDHEYDSTPLAPTGYEDLLRAIGHELDDRTATAIVVSECESFLLVHGLERVERGDESGYAHFDAVLDAHAITALLDAAFRRRASMPASTNEH